MSHQLSVNYVGYKDRSFVPFHRLLDVERVYGPLTEEEAKAQLCLVQKIGNGGLSCNILLDMGTTKWDRRMGKIKRNHYRYNVIAQIALEDMPVLRRLVKRKIGYDPEEGGQSQDVSDAPACDLGFCE